MIHICLFIFINLVTISQTYADIIAEDVSGQVFVRAPLSLRWYAVETDMILDAGMLIQTRQNSEVTLRFDGDAILRNIQGTNARLTLSTPTVLRIGPGIIRSISKTRKYMQALPNLGAFSFLVTQGKQANKEAPLAGWGDAFSRVTTAIIGGRGNKGSPFKKTSDIGKIKSQQAQFSLEIGQTPIEIITPTAFEIMPTHLPKKFRIEWIQPKAMKIAEQQTGRKIGYRIFLWPTNEDKPESPIAIAKSEFYSIPIKNYGTYWLQLESTDSKFTSEPKIVQSVPKTRDEENKIRQTYAREIPQAKFPSVPTIFAIPKGDRETEITFVWTNPFKQPIQFTLGREDQSKPIIDIVLPSNQLSASFTLGQGIYLWRLEDPVHNAKITLFSEIEFKIEPESKIDYFSYILDPDEEIKSDVVFYLPSGL